MIELLVIGAVLAFLLGMLGLLLLGIIADHLAAIRRATEWRYEEAARIELCCEEVQPDAMVAHQSRNGKPQ